MRNRRNDSSAHSLGDAVDHLTQLRANLAVAAAKCARDEQGNPYPHDLPYPHAIAIIQQLEAAWSLDTAELKRRIKNLQTGVVR